MGEKKSIKLKHSAEKIQKIKDDCISLKADIEEYIEVYEKFPKALKKQVIDDGYFDVINEQYLVLEKLLEVFGDVYES